VALALGLLSVGTFRAAGWLFVLCVLGACVAGSFAVHGGWAVGRVVFAVPVRALRDLGWLARGIGSVRGRSVEQPVRLGLSVVVGLLLVGVFGVLFAQADATFAGLVNALPSVDGRSVVVFALAGLGTTAAGHLLLEPPAATRRTDGTLRTVEWGVPVGLLVALFAVFVADQLAALFGGAGYVLRTAHLTYAQYARSGFWQLLLVTGLTLVVIAVTVAKARRSTRTERVWLRSLLGSLAGLTLVIVASALVRMWSYQQAYGFTVPRLCVETCELWLGAVYLLVIGAGVRLRLARLPRMAVAAGLTALLVLAVVNPERLVAGENVARYQETGRIDFGYLSDLSQDAIPGLAGLPAGQRDCVLHRMADELDPDADSWQAWNASRAAAHDELAAAVARC
jgi:hypothetical protein